MGVVSRPFLGGIGTPFSHSQKLHYCLVHSVYFHDQTDLVIINGRCYEPLTAWDRPRPQKGRDGPHHRGPQAIMDGERTLGMLQWHPKSQTDWARQQLNPWKWEVLCLHQPTETVMMMVLLSLTCSSCQWNNNMDWEAGMAIFKAILPVRGLCKNNKTSLDLFQSHSDPGGKQFLMACKMRGRVSNLHSISGMFSNPTWQNFMNISQISTSIPTPLVFYFLLSVS